MIGTRVFKGLTKGRDEGDKEEFCCFALMMGSGCSEILVNSCRNGISEFANSSEIGCGETNGISDGEIEV
ncbi:MAG: hypothetical protein F6K40_14875 [Okeania sp. SIO3I5]|nr:hypothetical protein [Okeania sp. SIO3I5]